MKKRTFIAALLAAVMLCSLLTACDQQKKPGESESTQQSSESESVQQSTEPEEKPIYSLEFTSNGDGTCYVSNIITNVTVSEAYTLEIPETSPEGDLVVAVDPKEALLDTAVQNVPTWMIAEDFETLCNTLKQNGMPNFDYIKFTAHYLKLSLTGLEEPERSQLIETFPITEYADIYVIDGNTEATMLAKISAQLRKYADFDAQDKYKADQKIAHIIKEHGVETVYEAESHYTAFMEKMVLPASVKSVNLPSSSFKEISFAGTRAQWEEVSYELNGLLGTRIVCSDGEVQLKSQYLIKADGRLAFLQDISENVTVKVPDTWFGEPRTDYYAELGFSTEPDQHLMLVEDYEALLAEMEQQGLADKAAKYRESMEIIRLGSVEYVTVYDFVYISTKISLPEDYFIKATMRVCEKTRVTEGLTVKNSKYFTGLELPATLEVFVVHIKSFDEIYLTDVYYPGTLEQWAQVQVVSADGVPWILSGITVHCSDGDAPLALTQ